MILVRFCNVANIISKSTTNKENFANFSKIATLKPDKDYS